MTVPAQRLKCFWWFLEVFYTIIFLWKLWFFITPQFSFMKTILCIRMKLIKTLKSKPYNIGKRSWVYWWSIRKSWRLFSFQSGVLNRTCFEVFINIILNIEKTEAWAITWLSFFVGLIFVPGSFLFTTTVTIWPITPRWTVTWLIAETRAWRNFIGFYCRRRTWKFESAIYLT